MLRIESRMTGPAPAGATVRCLVLPYAARARSRQRVVLDDGTEAGIFLPRGAPLREGECLADSAGGIVTIVAAAEEVYVVTAAAGSREPAFDLLRAAYHLGNRHVPVALSPGRLHLERDTVLRDLLLRLGLEVREAVARFEPEAGAYGGGHRHDHDATGGALGELLSRQAHANDVPDFSEQRFSPS